MEKEEIWNANNKVQFDNMITHCKALMTYSELALKQAIEFQQKANDAYLTERDRREQLRLEFTDAIEKQRLAQNDATEKQRLEHENELETHRQENNRYTLNYLYGIDPSESIGVIAIAKALYRILKAAEASSNGEEQ